MKKIYTLIIVMIIMIGCATENIEEDTPKDKLLYPIGLQLSADQSKLFISNSNFDLRYKGASVNVIDLDSYQLDINSTILTESFLSDFAFDQNLDTLFVISRENRTLYMIKIGLEGDKYLSCGDIDGCEDSYKLNLKLESPFSISIDQERKILYIGHRDEGYVTVVSYSADPVKMRIIKQFSIKNFVGNISDIEYNSEDKKVYVSSDSGKSLKVFKPIFDSNGYIASIVYYDSILITNSSTLLSYSPSTQDIYFFNGKIYLGLNNPSSISILEKSYLETTPTYQFSNKIDTDYYPVKISCIDDERCLATIYDSRKMIVFNPINYQMISIIDTHKRVYDFTYSSERKELYCALFAENGIMIIDMDENSSSYLQVKKIVE